MTDFLGEYTYYILGLIALIIAFFIIKNVASCLIRLIISIVLIAILVGGYLYFFEPELFEEVKETSKPIIKEMKDNAKEYTK